MCTFKDERTVVVCDVAIGQVRRAMEDAFDGGDGVRYTVVDGQGTLVEAVPSVDAQQFLATTQAAMAAVQAGAALAPMRATSRHTAAGADAPAAHTS